MNEVFIEIKNPRLTKSKWVKDLPTRMRVFNTQIFEQVYANHYKETKESNINYMWKTYGKLVDKAIEELSQKEVIEFIESFSRNMDKLLSKKLVKQPKEDPSKYGL